MRSSPRFFTAIKNDDHETLQRVLLPGSYQYLKRSEQLPTFLAHWGDCKVQGVGEPTGYYRAQPGEDKALKIWIDLSCPGTG